MSYFASWGIHDKRQSREFRDIESLLAWLQEYRAETAEWPPSLCIFKADCIFDSCD